MSRPLLKAIDIAALRANYDYIKSLCHSSRLMAVIKSNAYGHGMIEVANALPHADGFAVACVAEGMSLRQHGIQQKILVLQGPNCASEIDQAVAHHLAIVCHEPCQLEWIRQRQGEGIEELWVKFDTGMHRLGFAADQHAAVMSAVLGLSKLATPPVLMSHLANADCVDIDSMKEQQRIFDQIGNQYEGLPRSLANSGAALRDTDLHYDWVRSGLALYGCLPPNTQQHDGKLQPVMTLTAPVISIKDLNAGDRIGYGSTYTCTKAMRIAILSAGYGDGYPRHAQNGTPVWINGKICPIVGRVSMDMLAIDITNHPVQLGDQAELWGKQLAVSEVATHCDTIPYELLCAMTAAPTS